MNEQIRPKQHALDLAGLRVMLAMPTHRDLHPFTVTSLLNTQKALMERGIPFEIFVKYGSSLVHHARTSLAWDFLKSEANRLFWVDSDMSWEANDFIRLLALSTKLDIVAGAYPAKQLPPLFMVNADLEKIEVNEFGCLAMDGIGLGFCCMTRATVQHVADNAIKSRFGFDNDLVPHIFRYGEDGDGNAQGEDMAFFADAKKLGHQLWVDPTVKLGHIGPHVFTGSISDYLKEQLTTPGLAGLTV